MSRLTCLCPAAFLVILASACSHALPNSTSDTFSAVLERTADHSGQNAGRELPAATKKIYIIGYSDSMLSSFTLAGKPSPPNLGGLISPGLMAVTKAGKVFVVNTPTSTSTMTSYDSDNVETQPSLYNLTEYAGIAVASDGKLFITAGNAVDAFTATGALTTPIIKDGVDGATAVSVGPDGTIYVCNHNGNTITSYTPQGKRSALTINVSQPTTVAVNPSGKIFVATNGTIETFTSQGKPSTPTIPNANPVQLAFGENGAIYVAGLSQVETFSEAGKPTIPTIKMTNGYADGVGYDSTHKIIKVSITGALSQPGANVIANYDTSGHHKSTIPTGIEGSTGLSISHTGKMFVTSAEAIYAFTLSGQPASPTITKDINDPDDVFVDNTNGKIYVCNVGTQKVTTYTAAGVETTPQISVAWPTDAIVGPSGKIYVTSFETNQLTTYTSTGKQTTPTIDGLQSPSNVALDSQGRIYIVNSAGGNIATYSPSGKLLSPVIKSNLNQPQTIFIDSDGDIYVTNNGDETVAVFNKDGKFLSKFVDHIPGASDIVVH
jgi:streptogramin lyase